MNTIKIKKCKVNAQLPKMMTPGSSGFDLFSCEENLLVHMEPTVVWTGISLEMPSGYEAQVRSRSGLALKSNIMVLNSPGTIDQSYTGEIGVILMNFGKHPFLVKKGDRIAQIVFCTLPQVRLLEVESLTETERGEGGFGSTGV